MSQVETHLRTLYEGAYWKSELDDVHNLSRLLALHVLHLVLGRESDDETTLVEITDGSDDRGIDAVGVDVSGKVVVLVQSKWRQDGTGSMGQSDVLKFLDGVKSLIGMKSEDVPAHASDKVKTGVRELLKTPGARVRLVTATTASQALSEAVEQPIAELLAQLNDIDVSEPLAAHSHFDQAALFDSIAERMRPRVDIDVQMLDWGRATEPQRIYYGRVSAAAIASWFTAHGTDLFADNIRVVIPRSDINEGILRTIAEAPEQFIYFNNGITVLASAIDLGPAGALSRDVGYFKLSNASIVNGAQTVSTLGSAIGGTHEANLGNAFVLVRCIEVPGSEEDLGRQITRYANTQNEVSSQDFAFLDSEQHRLVRELGVLGFEYILRSAEVPKSKQRDKVIELRQAAVALACASPNLGHAVVAKREISRLFTDNSVYKALFNSATDPLRLARAVRLTAAVDEVLDKVEAESDGVWAGIAVHGRRVIAHLVMRDLGDVFLSNPASDMESVIADLDQKVRDHVAWFVLCFPANAYPGNVFKNQSRVVQLIRAASELSQASP